MRISILLLLACSVSAVNLQIILEPGPDWHHSFKTGLLTIHTTPQYAVWLTDSSGKYIATLSVSRKSAQSKFTGARKNSRPSALPVWAHTRGIKGDHNNFMPSEKNPLTDAVTSASLKNETKLICDVPDSLYGHDLRLRVEINNSMDFNEYFTKDAQVDNPGFNDKVNGQPSLVYEGILRSDKKYPDTLFLIGHGEPAGRNGTIYNDLSKITTASHIVKKIIIMNYK